ncbi:spermidine synthase-like [Liolophura sinensis]|uniref:spermidine synthase-like n=1 Tax=Liolophura sinensis TaxID=3198878 RepID=UPI0031583F5C
MTGLVANGRRWFHEVNDQWPGFGVSIEIEKILHEEQSKYQKIVFFKSKTFGTVLTLDDIVQCTERDEFSYQEMISLIPLNSHPNPQNVLVVGGGDGGVAREVVKHPAVKRVVVCEIDNRVIELSRKYLPNMAKGYDDPRVEINVGDGLEYMKEHENEFDVIITDSSDPIGPATVLFQKQYYELMYRVLKPEGIICSQGECLWLDMGIIREVFSFCQSIYPVVDYAFTTIPSYVGGQIGFILCSKNKNTKFSEPLRRMTDAEVEKCQLNYYNSDIHSAAFVLPQFAKKALYGIKKSVNSNHM